VRQGQALLQKVIVCAALCAFVVSPTLSAAEDGASQITNTEKLELVRSNERMPWNAVAVDLRGRVLVSSPIWSDSTGPAVAEVKPDGQLVPWPSRKWNSWKPGKSGADTFVSVNALHVEPDGSVWVVDTGAPKFGGSFVPGGPKVVQIDPRTDEIVRVYRFTDAALRPNTYIDDIRIRGRQAYMTDAGAGALMMLNLDTGEVRRRFDDQPYTKAQPDAKIVVNNKILRAPDGSILKVNADDLELSADGKYFYFAPLSGPMYRVETRYMEDASLDDKQLAEHVEKWFDMPPVGGVALAKDGTLYFTQLDDNSLKKRNVDGTVTLLIRDPRLRWVDAPFIAQDGYVYLPAAQLDGSSIFNHGHSTMTMPVQLFRAKL
jgi:sugar lactone lactonase YvrE